MLSVLRSVQFRNGARGAAGRSSFQHTLVFATEGKSAEAPRASPAPKSGQAPKGDAPKAKAVAGPKPPAGPKPAAGPKPTQATKPQGPKPPQAPKAPQYVDPWATILDAEKTGATLEVKVKAVNKGGLIATFGEMKGFLPYNQLAANTMRLGQATDLTFLVGQTLKAKVVSVDAENGNKNFVLSEKKVQQSAAMRNLKVGSVLKAVVKSVEDYGAFVELVDISNVSGLVHRSELSWDSFTSVDSVVQKDQVVMVKIIDLDVAKCRLGLSLKQTQPDPIKMTLDKVQWQATKSMPSEIQLLMERLKQQPGVEDVYIGRQAIEAKIASQELVVYLTKESSDDGLDVVARLGSVLQELHLVTKMSRDEGRLLLARAVSA